MRMPPEIRREIELLGGRCGVCLVRSRGVVVKVIQAKAAAADLPFMFRKIERYDSITWITLTDGEHMLLDLAKAQADKYDLGYNHILRPNRFYTHERALAKYRANVIRRDEIYLSKLRHKQG